MDGIEYRDLDPVTDSIRTWDGWISVREYVRRVRGMTVEQFEARYGPAVSETRNYGSADYDDYAVG